MPLLFAHKRKAKPMRLVGCVGHHTTGFSAFGRLRFNHSETAKASKTATAMTKAISVQFASWGD
jgi:hypothetical protein